MPTIFFLFQLVGTLSMTGIIWFVQVVHYPLFARVGESGFATYSQQHATRTGWVVAPLMLVELVTACLGLIRFFRPALLPLSWAVAGVFLLAIIWLSTGLLQVPLHSRLGLEYQAPAVHRLVRTNWIRTVCWTMGSCLLIGFLAAHAIR
jgi:hypothetical protein